MRDILIKASGDVTACRDFFDYIAEKAKESYVVLIAGGGTKISDALVKAGHAVEFNEHGRVSTTDAERKIMRQVLDGEVRRLQKIFTDKRVFVVPPILNVGKIVIPINGDNLVKAYYLGFSEIYVLTKKTRIKKKEEIFIGFPKVKIVGF